MRIALLSAVLLSAIAFPAFADDDNIIALPPEGTTIINLSVTERVKLPQDTLNATLNYQLDGASANEVQDKINKAVAESVAEAKKVPTVKTTTGSYYVYQFEESSVDPQTGKNLPNKKLWRGQQSIQLESENSAALLDLAGKIQSRGFTMQGLNYSLSQEKTDAAKDSLMERALKQLGAKSKIAATALGKGKYDIIDVNVDNTYTPQPPVMYARMAKMEMAADAAGVAAPTAEAGESEVTMTVTARVLLKP